MHRSPPALALLGAAALALPVTAGAVIVPQHSIAGVRVGATEAQVRAVAGAPVRVVAGANDFGAYRQLRYRGLTVTLQGGRRVTSVFTTSRAQRTRSGIGVGSTESALRRAIPVARCESVGDIRGCVVGEELPGRRVTRFSIQDGRVSRVIVGVVID